MRNKFYIEPVFWGNLNLITIFSYYWTPHFPSTIIIYISIYQIVCDSIGKIFIYLFDII